MREVKNAIIRSSWMSGYGHRLDCQPYVRGSLQTKMLLEKLLFRKDPLHRLTTGLNGGIYNGPQFAGITLHRRNMVFHSSAAVRCCMLIFQIYHC